MTQLSWIKLAELPDGARVVFSEDYDIFPECVVPAGTVATIVENSLNEMQPGLFLQPDDESIRTALKQWDGIIYLMPEADSGDPEDPAWQEPSPVEVAR
jgi:hypothetical protein